MYITTNNINSLSHSGILGPELNGDLVYKFNKIMDRTDISDQFRKVFGVICSEIYNLYYYC